MDDLTTLLHEAVDGLEPTDRLASIREQTAQRRPGRWIAAGGAALAAAAVVTGIAVVAQPDDQGGAGPSDVPSAIDSLPAEQHALPIYYVGDTPQGPRLFREWHRIPDGASLVGGTVMAGVDPQDPDYRTLWEGTTRSTLTSERRTSEGVERVSVPARLADRPATMSTLEAKLAIQQVVYTATAQDGDTSAVEFLVDGRPTDRVLGVPVDGPVTRAPQLDVLATVNISDPYEGRVVSGHFSANGVASSFEGSVPWQIKDASGAVVLSGMGQGSMDDHLTPWTTGPIDVSGLTPGTYTFVASTDDPTGGTEGSGPTTDTRTIEVR